jgi:hypothetical protein
MSLSVALSLLVSCCLRLLLFEKHLLLTICANTTHMSPPPVSPLNLHCMQALLWFRSPPRYFARCSRHTAQQQLAALEAFVAELDSLVALGAAGGIKWKQDGWPSYDCGCMPGAGMPDACRC